MVQPDAFTQNDLGRYLILAFRPFPDMQPDLGVRRVTCTLGDRRHVAGQLEEIADDGVWLGNGNISLVAAYRKAHPRELFPLGRTEREERIFVPYDCIDDITR